MQAYQGSCHCGAIRFSFQAEPITGGVRCNCSFCSRRGTMVHLVPGEHFKAETRDDALAVYQSGPKRVQHYFCKHCGVSTFSEATRWPGQYIVNLGCVEGVDTFALETTVFDGRHLL
ncbi:MAG TPA: GFA family protein [Gallionellaceae bacterium]|nr:GFA family protein [Gallionellaceae bacterium]